MVPGGVAVWLDSFIAQVLEVRGQLYAQGIDAQRPFCTRLDVAHTRYICFVKDGNKNFLSQPGFEPAFLIVKTVL
jgi:hypothetical protein